MPQERVSEWTHEQLKKIKEKNGHSTMDSVIRMLLHEYERSKMFKIKPKET